MGLKDIVRNNIVTPAVTNGENSSHALAEVLKADEVNNVCRIRYKDNKDRPKTKENVPVRIYSQSMIDWFPKKGEAVIIQIIGGEPIILGSPEIFSGTKSRSDNTLESDIYSDNMTCNTEGGYIY